MMAGARFLVAGLILFIWRRLARGERAEPGHWPGATLIGALLFMGGNGAVVWSEQRVPSGLTALLLATIPIWMVLLDTLGRGGAPLNGRVMTGLVLGLAGLAVLLDPSDLLGEGRVDLPAAGVLMAGSLCWATGSLVSRRILQPASHALAAGMQMTVGGVILFLVSAATGEFHRLDPALVSARALLALGYLIFFGSVVSFTAYTWLLSVASPARVSTYAFVNPVVAVLLGWTLAAEPLTPRTLLASVVIVTAVATIISARARREVSAALPAAKGIKLEV
jgi:drug/metabolite transporter (DMT)-like permease